MIVYDMIESQESQIGVLDIFGGMVKSGNASETLFHDRFCADASSNFLLSPADGRINGGNSGRIKAVARVVSAEIRFALIIPDWSISSVYTSIYFCTMNARRYVTHIDARTHMNAQLVTA